MKVTIDGVTYKRKEEKHGECVGCVAVHPRVGIISHLCMKLPSCLIWNEKKEREQGYIWIKYVGRS